MSRTHDWGLLPGHRPHPSGGRARTPSPLPPRRGGEVYPDLTSSSTEPRWPHGAVGHPLASRTSGSRPARQTSGNPCDDPGSWAKAPPPPAMAAACLSNRVVIVSLGFTLSSGGGSTLSLTQFLFHPSRKLCIVYDTLK